MSFNGLVDLPWWGYIVVALVMTHITIASVTIFLHRHQAHRGLDLHPIPSHFFRFWLWLTTGMVTKQWVAIHRKHHAKCETEEDPHSPQVVGIKKVLWEGAELYRAEAKVQETLDKYGHGTPSDWLERNVYEYNSVGIALMFIIDVVLFGALGISIWAIQMFWIPFFAAGVINGIGHYWGYRNFQSEDQSRNIVPFGFIIGGEELHNNHHAYGTSARFSTQWYEFDIGWIYIRALELIGLAKVRKLAPKIKFDPAKVKVDIATLQAVITHRYDVLMRFFRSVRPTWHEEFGKVAATHKSGDVDGAALKRLLLADPAELDSGDQEKLHRALASSKVLATLYSMRQELAQLWQRSTSSKEQLVKQLEDWCHRAESSGILTLQDFSKKLRSYA